MGEISPKYHVSVVMETKEGIKMSKGKNIQKDQHISPKFRYLPILIDEAEKISPVIGIFSTKF